MYLILAFLYVQDFTGKNIKKYRLRSLCNILSKDDKVWRNNQTNKMIFELIKVVHSGKLDK